MIPLSKKQADTYALPLLEMCMEESVYKKAQRDFQASPDCSDCWGLFDMDQLIALGGIGSEISPRKVWLGYLAVHPEYRCKGLGTRVMAFVETEAAKRGYRWMFVETYDGPTYDNARALYRKMKYKEVGFLADYLDDDSDIIYYRKALPIIKEAGNVPA